MASGTAHNHLVLTGSLVKSPQLKRSPAGVQHLQLVVEHRSEQIEAGLPRQSYLRIQAIASGDWVKDWANQLQLGDVVELTGFLQRHQTANGVSKLVLHAQTLKQVY